MYAETVSGYTEVKHCMPSSGLNYKSSWYAKTISGHSEATRFMPFNDLNY